MVCWVDCLKIAMGKKYQLTTEYKGISQIYFNKLLNTIIRVGKLERDNLSILDYGSGYGVLKKILHKRNKSVNVINFDIEPELTDIKDWHNVDFNVVVANQVFEFLTVEDLERFLLKLKSINIKVELVVGTSKQSIFNMIGKLLLGKTDAHKFSKIKPVKELEILCKYMNIAAHESVWHLADVYRFKFKR